MSSLVLIKPDAIEHKLLGWCMACFEHQGIGDIGLVQMDEELCRKHYVDHQAKDFYPGLQAFMCSAPVCAIAVNGPVDAVRSIAMGIRRQHKQYVSGPRNLVHSSDSLPSENLTSGFHTAPCGGIPTAKSCRITAMARFTWT